MRREGGDKRVDHAPDDASQRGVEDCRVFALQQADTPDLMPERDRHLWPEHFAHQRCGLELLHRVLERERAGDRDAIKVRALREHPAHLIHVQRVHATIDLDTTPHDPGATVNRRAQIDRPTSKRLHRLRGRTRQPEHRNTTELAAAQDCVERMRRAKRNRRDLVRVWSDNFAESLGDASDRILGGGRLRAR